MQKREQKQTVFYAVKVGKMCGIFLSWPECQSQVSGYPGAIFKKFSTWKQAEDFINGSDSATICNESTVTLSHIATISIKETIIFTDGACCLVDVSLPDGSTKREQRAGFGYYVPSLDRRVARPLAPPYTNNRAELMAVLEAISEWPETSYLHIVTDSRYVVLIFTGTGLKYASKGYIDEQGQPVKNADLVRRAVRLLAKYQLEFTRVDAHTGKMDFWSRGNAVADQLAVEGARSSAIGSK